MDIFPIKGKIINYIGANPITGYKIFNPDWSCRGFKYEIGKTYEMPEQPHICSNGFHFCCEMIDLFKYYLFNSHNKIAKVKAYGAIDGLHGIYYHDSKLCTNKIEIVEEVKWEDILRLLPVDNNGNVGNSNAGSNNFGSRNTGSSNTGDYNSGDFNCGNYNIGNHNCGSGNIKNYNYGHNNNGEFNWGSQNFGDYNYGDGNIGHHNHGDQNYGSNNIGDKNNGNNNNGFRNDGDFNIGNYHFGSFNTVLKPEELRMFNKPIDYNTYMDEWVDSGIRDALITILHPTWWAAYHDNEISTYTDPQIALCIRGELHGLSKEKFFMNNSLVFYSNEIVDKMKKWILDLPNFDSEIFKQCTGIWIKK